MVLKTDFEILLSNMAFRETNFEIHFQQRFCENHLKKFAIIYRIVTTWFMMTILENCHWFSVVKFHFCSSFPSGYHCMYDCWSYELCLFYTGWLLKLCSNYMDMILSKCLLFFPSLSDVILSTSSSSSFCALIS